MGDKRGLMEDMGNLEEQENVNTLKQDKRI
jgi:hypothetical protein